MKEIFDSINEEKVERFQIKKSEPLIQLMNEHLKYYLKNVIFENNEEELQKFYDSLNTTLPLTYRFIQSIPESRDVMLYIIKNVYLSLKNLKDASGSLIPLPQLLPWYPGQMAFQYDAQKRDINKEPDFVRFKNILLNGAESGILTRQESVSLLPVLFLNIRHDSKILELCAAPGSKTTQIVDHLEQEIQNNPDCGDQKGFLVCNDINARRMHVLIARIKCLSSHRTVFTTHNAQSYPQLADFSQSSKHQDESGKELPLFFDSILCDVPCSGDGTLRKNYKLMKTWKFSDALALYPLQASILARAVMLCKVGGRIVYSTCSMNPVENEAVVLSALRRFRGKLQLVDATSHYKTLTDSLEYCEGFSHWNIETNSLKMSKMKRSKLGCLSPNYSEFKDSPKDFNLERCIRVYPHHQNTGGFFIAILEKNETMDPADTLPVKRDVLLSKTPIFECINDIPEALKESLKYYNLESRKLKFIRPIDSVSESPNHFDVISEEVFSFLDRNRLKLKVMTGGCTLFKKTAFSSFSIPYYLPSHQFKNFSSDLKQHTIKVTEEFFKKLICDTNYRRDDKSLEKSQFLDPLSKLNDGGYKFLEVPFGNSSLVYHVFVSEQKIMTMTPTHVLDLYKYLFNII